jgi:DHA1 family tetracycline resistance protein-like MFS transporter
MAHPVLSRVLLVTLISTAAFAGMESVFGLWTQARFGWGPKQVGLCFAVIGVIASVGQALITGRLARRFGEAKVLTDRPGDHRRQPGPDAVRPAQRPSCRWRWA